MTRSILKKGVRSLACLALILALSLSLVPFPARAAAAMPGVSSSALLEFKAAGTIPVYNSADCTVRGCAGPQKRSYNAYISGGDVCRISSISGGIAYVQQYPAGNGTRSGYVRLRDVFLADAPSRIVTAADGCTVYYDTAGQKKYGSIAAGDSVWVMGGSGSYTMVIYDAPSGSRKFKAGFVSAADLSRIAPQEDLVLSFRCHVAQLGDQPAVELKPGGAVTFGTVELGLAIEEITAKVESGDASLALMVHAQNLGDSPVAEGRSVTRGSRGEGRRLEGVSLALKGSAAALWSIEYRVHVQNVGWMDWVADGAFAGTRGRGLRLESVEIRLVRKDGGSAAVRWPVTNVKVCGNDWNEYYAARAKQGRPYHLGVDICSSTGNASIYAFADGTVAATGFNSANGNFVILKHNLGGQTCYSFYAHLSKISVNKGDSLRAGDTLGVIGNTGSGSSGTHLHFAVVSALWEKGGYWGYGSQKGAAVTYDGVTYYDPHSVVRDGRLPG